MFWKGGKKDIDFWNIKNMVTPESVKKPSCARPRDRSFEVDLFVVSG